MTQIVGAALLVGLLLSACAGGSIRGGRAVAVGDEPEGEVIGIFDPEPCVDAAGEPVEWRTRLFLIEQDDLRRIIVEVRSQYDSLVYSNVFEEEGESVFHLVVGRRPEPRLHQVRVPASVSALPGSFTVGALGGSNPRGERFRASMGPVAVRCRLTPVS